MSLCGVFIVLEGTMNIPHGFLMFIPLCSSLTCYLYSRLSSEHFSLEPHLIPLTVLVFFINTTWWSCFRISKAFPIPPFVPTTEFWNLHSLDLKDNLKNNEMPHESHLCIFFDCYCCVIINPKCHNSFSYIFICSIMCLNIVVNNIIKSPALDFIYSNWKKQTNMCSVPSNKCGGEKSGDKRSTLLGSSINMCQERPWWHVEI